MDFETAAADRPKANAASLMEPDRAAIRNMTQCCNVNGNFSSCGSWAILSSTALTAPLPEPESVVNRQATRRCAVGPMDETVAIDRQVTQESEPMPEIRVIGFDSQDIGYLNTSSATEDC